MVIVDVQIAVAVNSHVDQCVPGKLIQHVIEEPDPRTIVVGARPIKVERDRNVGLCGFPGECGRAHGYGSQVLDVRPAHSPVRRVGKGHPGT